MKRALKKKARMQPPDQMTLENQCGCGGRLLYVKSWELKGKGAGKKHKPTGTTIDLFQCEKCKRQTRRSRKLPEKETPKK